MRYATTNQTQINAIASDDVEFLLENINAGMSINDAIEAQVEGAMEDQFDETNFDAPFNPKQLAQAYREAIREELTTSANEVNKYRRAHEECEGEWIEYQEEGMNYEACPVTTPFGVVYYSRNTEDNEDEGILDKETFLFHKKEVVAA